MGRQLRRFGREVLGDFGGLVRPSKAFKRQFSGQSYIKSHNFGLRTLKLP